MEEVRVQVSLFFGCKCFSLISASTTSSTVGSQSLSKALQCCYSIGKSNKQKDWTPWKNTMKQATDALDSVHSKSTNPYPSAKRNLAVLGLNDGQGMSLLSPELKCCH